MKRRLYKKGIVFGIVILFIGASVVPVISGKQNIPKTEETNPNTSSAISNTATISLHTYDKTTEKQKKDIKIPTDAANEINNIFEQLKQKITTEPHSKETKTLKNRLINLLDLHGLIPNGLTKNYIHTLLNPSWLKNKQKTPSEMRPVFPVLKNIITQIISVFTNLQQFFKTRLGETTPQEKTKDALPTAPYAETGTATFCSMASGGEGAVLPLFLLPRPRGLAIWYANQGVTAAAELLSPVGEGFIAEGAQSGLAIGFVGLGLTFAIPGEMAYGFIGYTLFTSVNAENIEFFPPNQEPIISDENPPDGTEDIPLSLTELSFRIKDPEGKLMSYTVTTDPDIGSGSGILKPDGIYTIPVSGLEYDKKYTWTIKVTDDQETATKQFRFYTVIGPPFNPYNEGWQYRKKITIDHTMVNGDLTNFPVLISMTDTDLKDKAQSDGDDILFMDDPDTANKQYHEIEYYSSSTGELVAWVKTPVLSSNIDTVLYMYYGNPSCSSQEYPERAWDSSYIHVWHLGDSLTDSSGSDNGNNHGTSIVSGKIGKSRDFEEDEQDYIDFGDMSQPGDGSLTTMTWEAWVKPEEEDIEIMNKYDTSGTDYSSYFLGFRFGGKFHITASSAWGVNTKGSTDDSYSVIGEWIYLTGTYNLGGTNDISAFINGDEVAFTHESKSANVMRNTPVTDNLGRCRYEGGTGYVDAVIDEVRWSKTVRSDAWINTSFNTMNDPSSFFNVGPEESAP